MLQHGMEWIVSVADLKVALLLGVLVILVVLYLNQRSNGRDPDEETTDQKSPLEHLQLRYVSGEINDEQYEHMRQGLTHG